MLQPAPVAGRSFATGDRTILGNLSLFFVPAGVGVIAHLPVLSQHGIGLALAVTVSTILAIAAGALTFAAVARMTGSRDD